MPDITEMRKTAKNSLRTISSELKIQSYNPNISLKIFLFESITFITIS